MSFKKIVKFLFDSTLTEQSFRKYLNLSFIAPPDFRLNQEKEIVFERSKNTLRFDFSNHMVC